MKLVSVFRNYVPVISFLLLYLGWTTQLICITEFAAEVFHRRSWLPLRSLILQLKARPAPPQKQKKAQVMQAFFSTGVQTGAAW